MIKKDFNVNFVPTICLSYETAPKHFVCYTVYWL